MHRSTTSFREQLRRYWTGTQERFSVSEFGAYRSRWMRRRDLPRWEETLLEEARCRFIDVVAETMKAALSGDKSARQFMSTYIQARTTAANKAGSDRPDYSRESILSALKFARESDPDLSAPIGENETEEGPSSS